MLADETVGFIAGAREGESSGVAEVTVCADDKDGVVAGHFEGWKLISECVVVKWAESRT